MTRYNRSSPIVEDRAPVPFRFVHTADLHLDSPLRTLAMRDERLAGLVADATRTALTRIVDLCLEEDVQALVIAGDLYDGGQTSMKTALFLARELARLDAAGIRTFVVRGNHDAASRITRELALPESVTVFGGRAEMHTLERDGLLVAIHGISFSNPHMRESLFDRFKAPVPDALNIGIMHASLDGARGHDLYAPVSSTVLRASGFDYWALGHVHAGSQDLSGSCAIVMPGMPQGRDIGEAGEKSVVLATIGEDRRVEIVRREVASLRFERLALDARGVEDEGVLLERAERALRDLRGRISTEHLVVRPTIACDGALAWRLRRDRDALEARLRDRAEDVGGTWIEAVEIEGSEAATVSGGALADLARILRDETLTDPGVVGEAGRIASELVRVLPPEVRDAFGTDENALGALVREALADAAEEALASLHDLPREEEMS